MSNWFFFGAIIYSNLNISDESKFGKYRGEIVQYNIDDYNGKEYFQNYIYPKNYPPINPKHHTIHFCDNKGLYRNFTYNYKLKTCTDQYNMIYTTLCNIKY